MRFLVDAQLSWRLARALRANGHDAVHTSDLAEGNRSPDGDVTAIADREDRVLITKDDDFVVSHLLRGRPARLLLVTAGNTANSALLVLVESALPDLERAFQSASFVELTSAGITLRD